MADHAGRPTGAPVARDDRSVAAGGDARRPRLLTGESTALLLLALVGAYLAFSAFGLGLQSRGAWVGPGSVPLAVGAPLCLIAVGRLIGLARRGEALAGMAPTTADQDEDVDDRDIFGRTAAYRVRQLWTVLAALAVAILLVPVLGFPVAFGALVFFASTVVERQRLLPAVAITAVSLVAVHLIFVMFLGVPLPNGLLEGVLP
jgi:hypothetical protein